MKSALRDPATSPKGVLRVADIPGITGPKPAAPAEAEPTWAPPPVFLSDEHVVAFAARFIAQPFPLSAAVKVEVSTKLARIAAQGRLPELLQRWATLASAEEAQRYAQGALSGHWARLLPLAK